MTPIAIPHEVRAWVYAQAVAAYPAECCGYLVGPADGVAVDTGVACRNALEDDDAPAIAPDRRVETGFVIAGAELLRFARAFDTDRPPRIVYHSHTNGRAYFSELDRAMAAGPTYPVQHLVVGVALRTVTEAAQFAWSETQRDYVEVARWTP